MDRGDPVAKHPLDSGSSSATEQSRAACLSESSSPDHKQQSMCYLLHIKWNIFGPWRPSISHYFMQVTYVLLSVKYCGYPRLSVQYSCQPLSPSTPCNTEKEEGRKNESLQEAKKKQNKRKTKIKP